MPAQQVSVAHVVKKAVSTSLEWTGRVEAKEMIEIRPRVSGYLDQVHFQEGGWVHQGDLLFTIDDREYQAALESARAALASAQTAVGLARAELARTQTLADAKAAAQEELEQRQAQARQASAEREAAAARLRQAELNLQFTRIRSPIDGRVGHAEVRPGNLVTPAATLLTTVVSSDPIYVRFDGDERLLRAARATSSQAQQAIQVEVGLSAGNDYPLRGTLDFIDNQLNPATGTLRARASLPNPEGTLVPGQFARVRLQAPETREALLIHERAVLTDQNHKYVYVLGPKNTAVRKDVALGPAVGGLRVVESGLAADDQVIVNGTRKIFMPNQEVAPITVPMDQPESAAAAAGQQPAGSSSAP